MHHSKYNYDAQKFDSDLRDDLISMLNAWIKNNPKYDINPENLSNITFFKELELKGGKCPDDLVKEYGEDFDSVILLKLFEAFKKILSNNLVLTRGKSKLTDKLYLKSTA